MFVGTCDFWCFFQGSTFALEPQDQTLECVRERLIETKRNQSAYGSPVKPLGGLACFVPQPIPTTIPAHVDILGEVHDIWGYVAQGPGVLTRARVA